MGNPYTQTKEVYSVSKISQAIFYRQLNENQLEEIQPRAFEGLQSVITMYVQKATNMKT